MSDRPQSNSPPDVPDDIGAHPLRELYLCNFREQGRPVLAVPLDLLLAILLEGDHLDAYLQGRKYADLADEAAAAVRDLEFTATFLTRMGRGSALEYEDETLARSCRSIGEQVGTIAATLTQFLSP